MPRGKPAITSGPIARPTLLDRSSDHPAPVVPAPSEAASGRKPASDREPPATGGRRAAPAERGDTVGAPEVPREISRNNIAYPSADLLHRQSVSTSRRRASAMRRSATTPRSASPSCARLPW
jgi:hypothetical protein